MGAWLVTVALAEADAETFIRGLNVMMAEVKENCFISNSIAADVKLTPQFKLASDVAT